MPEILLKDGIVFTNENRTPVTVFGLLPTHTKAGLSGLNRVRLQLSGN